MTEYFYLMVLSNQLNYLLLTRLSIDEMYIMMFKMKKAVEFGDFVHELRTQKKLSQRVVADKLGIDISLLSKIEHGERQLQGRMLAGLADLFELDYRALQIKYLNQRIKSEFGDEPFFIDSLKNYIENIEQ